MNRREFLRRGAAAVAAAACARIEPGRGAADAPRRPPNVLYVFSDQHRAVSLPGEPFNSALAPNLDAFRKQSFSMDTCVSNYPLCTPYRGILMTGRWPHQTGLTHNGAHLATNEDSLGLIFQKAGYHTGYVGKWHLGADRQFIPKGPERQGFVDWHVWAKTNNHYHAWTYDQDTGQELRPEGWNCTAMTDQALAFLARQSKDRPWLLMLSWNPPHPPFNPPEEDEKPYAPESLRFRPNVRLSLEGKRAGKGEAHALTSDAHLRQAARGYFGGITGVDGEFARLLKALDDGGQAQDTVVVYTSDHGEMMGSHGRMAKQVPFEESCRVPFFVRYPGITPAGGKSDALFAAIDIYPTLCGLAGVPVPAGRGGRDLSRLMTGQAAAADPSEIVFLLNQGKKHTENNHLAAEAEADDDEDPKAKQFAKAPNYRGARTRTHTYAVTPDGRWCLYDNVADPYQMKNLVRDPAHQKLMAELDAKILAWMETTGDPFPYRAALGKFADEAA